MSLNKDMANPAYNYCSLLLNWFHAPNSTRELNVHNWSKSAEFTRTPKRDKIFSRISSAIAGVLMISPDLPQLQNNVQFTSAVGGIVFIDHNWNGKQLLCTEVLMHIYTMTYSINSTAEMEGLSIRQNQKAFILLVIKYNQSITTILIHSLSEL